MATPLPPSPFITEPDRRFVLDVDAFMEAIEPAPSWKRSNRRKYLTAADLMPVLAVLAGY